ncbi:hypothetical protein Sgou_41160 [Streptomyces gougerotii]|uniref:Secreted protein n=4 Tax=Streptomyces TaxID=1883 RepID=A0ABQ1DAH2_9ACTN|nr:hypothetical protein EES47_15820 [Streptomyces sp. ADI98-12]GFH79446.1 hypothetical protein Sgou_41160 [Streptomyces gougerotii]GGU10058.1 hypothetical protein GCM10015534_10480 [Streptomyces diastaticus subsp. diastaticus]SUP60406.1 Uncharacterised protein [Streptomyces griseus]
MGYGWVMSTLTIVFVSVVVAFLAGVFLLVRAGRPERQAAERRRASLREGAAAYGWRVVTDERMPEQPATVRRGIRAGDPPWMVGRQRLQGVDVWVVCHEGMGLGAEVVRSVVVHLRPLRRVKDLPRVRVDAPAPVLRWPARGRDPFERRYRIAARDRARARALVTEEVRARTLELDLDGWELRDGIVTVRFPGMRGPRELQRRLDDLVRLSEQIAGPPPGSR